MIHDNNIVEVTITHLVNGLVVKCSVPVAIVSERGLFGIVFGVDTDMLGATIVIKDTLPT